MNARIKTPDAVVYVDEAGVLGRTSRLRPQHDDQLGVFAGLVFRGDRLTAAIGAFSQAFERFKAAAPASARLHITDAYAPGNEAWARVADRVREDAYDLVGRLDIPVLFEAQRLRDLRELRDILGDVAAQAVQHLRSGVEVKAPASKEHVEGLLIEALLEKLEVYGEDFELGAVEVRLDEVAAGLFKTYKAKLDELRGIDDTTQKVTGYHRRTGTLRHGRFRICVRGASAAVKRVLGFKIAGKDDPLVLLVDIVANSLNDYLSRLDVAAPADEANVAGWVLGASVWPRR